MQENNSGLALAPSLMGLNNNLDFMGKRLHVQTENAAFPVAHILTQVFYGGRVLASKKSEYPPGVREAQDFSAIQELMRKQHYEVIQEIKDKQIQILNER
jgi:hypothetical protein